MSLRPVKEYSSGPEDNLEEAACVDIKIPGGYTQFQRLLCSYCNFRLSECAKGSLEYSFYKQFFDRLANWNMDGFTVSHMETIYFKFMNFSQVIVKPWRKKVLIFDLKEQLNEFYEYGRLAILKMQSKEGTPSRVQGIEEG